MSVRHLPIMILLVCAASLVSMLVSILGACGSRSSEQSDLYMPDPPVYVSTAPRCEAHPPVLVALHRSDCERATELIGSLDSLSVADRATALGQYARTCRQDEASARSHFQAAIAAGDTCRGTINLHAGSPDHADEYVTACASACALRRGVAYAARGQARLDAGRPGDAEADFRVALQLFADYPEDSMETVGVLAQSMLDAGRDIADVRADIEPQIRRLWPLLERHATNLYAMQGAISLALLYDTGLPQHDTIFRGCAALARDIAARVDEPDVLSQMTQIAGTARPNDCPLRLP